MKLSFGHILPGDLRQNRYATEGNVERARHRLVRHMDHCSSVNIQIVGMFMKLVWGYHFYFVLLLELDGKMKLRAITTVQVNSHVQTQAEISTYICYCRQSSISVLDHVLTLLLHSWHWTPNIASKPRYYTGVQASRNNPNPAPEPTLHDGNHSLPKIDQTFHRGPGFVPDCWAHSSQYFAQQNLCFAS